MHDTSVRVILHLPFAARARLTAPVPAPNSRIVRSLPSAFTVWSMYADRMRAAGQSDAPVLSTAALLGSVHASRPAPTGNRSSQPPFPAALRCLGLVSDLLNLSYCTLRITQMQIADIRAISPVRNRLYREISAFSLSYLRAQTKAKVASTRSYK